MRSLLALALLALACGAAPLSLEQPVAGEPCECEAQHVAPGFACELYVPPPAAVASYRGEVGPGWETCYWRAL